MEEELRLMYVAASRAEENLYFSYPVNIYDRGTAMLLSRPPGLLKGYLRPYSNPGLWQTNTMSSTSHGTKASADGASGIGFPLDGVIKGLRFTKEVRRQKSEQMRWLRFKTL